MSYKKYPKNWKRTIRPRILNRANYKCEFKNCDNEHGQYLWSVRIKGTVRREWFKSPNEAYQAALNSGWTKRDLDPIIKEVKVKLNIAHLDHDPENHEVSEERLKAACQMCHFKYDAENNKEKRKVELDAWKDLLE